MKLAVFVDQVFWFDGRFYSTDESYIKFVTAFTAYFDEIVLYGRVANEAKTGEYRLDSAKTSVYPLPWYEDVYSLWARWPVVFPKVVRSFTRTHQTWDLLWLTMPHPLGALLAHLCRSKNRPFFTIIRQNLVEQVKQRTRGLRKLLGVTTAIVMERHTRRLAMRHPTFAVGDELYGLYKRNDNPVFRATVSVVSEKDIRAPRKAGATFGHTVKLLSVGRLDPEKGLTDLITAAHELIERRGIAFTLTIVGTGSEQDQLKREVSRVGLDEHVHFPGYVPYGPELLRLYRESDVFLLPSFTEGCPQVLIEAMACGVPVIATRVGGIPHLIRDGQNGLLVDPANARQLAGAVRRLVEDRDLRDSLIENGLATAREHSMEAEVGRMMATLRQSFPALGI